MLDINEIARETALRSGTLLGKDDPILISVSINEKIISHYTSLLLKEQLDQQKLLSSAIERNHEMAKQASSQTITKVGQYVHDQVISAGKQVSELLGNEIRAEGRILQQELQQLRSGLTAQVRSIHWLLFAMTSLTTALLGLWLGLYLAR